MVRNLPKSTYIYLLLIETNDTCLKLTQTWQLKLMSWKFMINKKVLIVKDSSGDIPRRLYSIYMLPVFLFSVMPNQILCKPQAYCSAVGAKLPAEMIDTTPWCCATCAHDRRRRSQSRSLPSVQMSPNPFWRSRGKMWRKSRNLSVCLAEGKRLTGKIL